VKTESYPDSAGGVGAFGQGFATNGFFFAPKHTVIDQFDDTHQIGDVRVFLGEQDEPDYKSMTIPATKWASYDDGHSESPDLVYTRSIPSFAASWPLSKKTFKELIGEPCLAIEADKMQGLGKINYLSEKDYTFGYTSSTSGEGSSGCPVLDADGNVIGMHIRGGSAGVPNVAIYLPYYINKFNSGKA
jgi:hypothetical protein